MGEARDVGAPRPHTTLQRTSRGEHLQGTSAGSEVRHDAIGNGRSRRSHGREARRCGAEPSGAGTVPPPRGRAAPAWHRAGHGYGTGVLHRHGQEPRSHTERFSRRERQRPSAAPHRSAGPSSRAWWPKGDGALASGTAQCPDGAGPCGCAQGSVTPPVLRRARLQETRVRPEPRLQHCSLCSSDVIYSGMVLSSPLLFSFSPKRIPAELQPHVTPSQVFSPCCPARSKRTWTWHPRTFLPLCTAAQSTSPHLQPWTHSPWATFCCFSRPGLCSHSLSNELIRCQSDSSPP